MRKIARDAVKNDNWMRPVVERTDDLEDYGQFAMGHRESWEGTSQYQCQYGYQISCIIDEQMEAGAAADFVEGRIALLEELTDMFWDEWEARARLFEAWKKAKEKFAKEQQP